MDEDTKDAAVVMMSELKQWYRDIDIKRWIYREMDVYQPHKHENRSFIRRLIDDKSWW